MSDNTVYYSLPVLSGAFYMLLYPDVPTSISVPLGMTLGAIASATAYLLFAELGPSDYNLTLVPNHIEFTVLVENAKSPTVYAAKQSNGLYRVTYGSIYTVDMEESAVKSLSTLNHIKVVWVY